MLSESLTKTKSESEMSVLLRYRGCVPSLEDVNEALRSTCLEQSAAVLAEGKSVRK